MSSRTISNKRPDYFSEPPSLEDAVIRRIKGNFRREIVFKTSLTEGWSAIPEDLRAHDIPEQVKNALASGAGPQARGGEDLPDLAPGEVEIARLSLVNSVHGEVTSLRAKRHPEASSVLLSMVDEYGTEFQLPMCKISAPLTAEEVLAIFRDAEPTPTETSCQIRFSSFFYADLDALAIKMGIKSSDETNDNVEFQVTRKEAAPTGKSKIRQALDGDLNTHFTKESSEAAKQRMRKKLRGETVVDTPTPTSKDYIYAALGTVAFCIALSFTQAGSVLLRNRFGSGELLARAIV